MAKTKIAGRRLAANKLSCWRADTPLFAGRALGPFVIYEDEPPFYVTRADQSQASKHDTFEAAYEAMALAAEAWAVERQSWVYFIGTELRANRLIKIGTALDVSKRLRQLQSGSPVPLSILGVTRGDSSLERDYHDKWTRFRAHGEWFRLTPAICRYVAALPRPEIEAEIDRLREVV